MRYRVKIEYNIELTSSDPIEAESEAIRQIIQHPDNYTKSEIWEEK